MYAASLLRGRFGYHYARDLGLPAERAVPVRFSTAEYSAWTIEEARNLAQCGFTRNRVYRIADVHQTGLSFPLGRPLFVLFARPPKHRLVVCGDWYGLLDWPLQPL